MKPNPGKQDNYLNLRSKIELITHLNKLSGLYNLRHPVNSNYLLTKGQ